MLFLGNLSFLLKHLGSVRRDNDVVLKVRCYAISGRLFAIRAGFYASGI